MYWKEETLKALHRLSERNTSNIISRQELTKEELDRIAKAAYSSGKTPAQTLSRVLQDLRDEGALYFLGRGKYLLLDEPIDIEKEDVPEKAIDFAIKKEKLFLGIIPAEDQQQLTRQRLGQNRIRALTLQNYRFECALCNLKDKELLEASHISRWADDPEARGKLSNIICLCKFHHILFEKGYISIDDSYQVLKKDISVSLITDFIMRKTDQFKLPNKHPPAKEFLRKHRERAGFKR